MNTKIPKIIHQLWVGDTLIPTHCQEYVDLMKKLHPNWNVKLWGNEIFHVYKDDIYLKSYLKDPESYKWAFICDRLRLLLLRDFGGIYVDVDAKPIRPFDNILKKLHPEHTFFAGLKPSQTPHTLIDCTVYGSVPNSRAIDLALSTYYSVTWANGCEMFSDILISEMDTDIALFGHRYFYGNDPLDELCIVLHDIEETRLFSWQRPECDNDVSSSNSSEKGVKVCNQGGNISEGDLLTESDTEGYLMKQPTEWVITSFDGDNKPNYEERQSRGSHTVAKSMEDVTFDSEGKSKVLYGYLYCV